MSSQPPTATIVINNYNYGRYLREAIDSALAQTWPRVEVVVVDDGSTDDSREIILSYGQHILTVLKPNGGQGSAFNAGYALAKGDVIYFLDSDDRYLPDTVARTMPFFTSAEVTKVHWPVTLIDEQGTKSNLLPRAALGDGDLSDRALSLGPASHEAPPSSANAWSRHFLNQVMPVDAVTFWQHVDSWLFTTSPFCGRIVAIDEPLSDYRRHDRNDSLRVNAEEKVRLWEVRASLLHSWLAERGIETSIEEWRQNNRYYRRLLAQMATLGDE